MSIAAELFVVNKEIRSEEEQQQEENDAAVLIFFMCAAKQPNIHDRMNRIVIKLYIGGGKAQKMEIAFKAAHVQLQRTCSRELALITLDNARIKKE